MGVEREAVIMCDVIPGDTDRWHADLIEPESSSATCSSAVVDQVEYLYLRRYLLGTLSRDRTHLI